MASVDHETAPAHSGSDLPEVDKQYSNRDPMLDGDWGRKMIGEILRGFANPGLDSLLSYVRPDDKFKDFDQAGIDREAAYAAIWIISEYWGANNIPKQMTLSFDDIELETPSKTERDKWLSSITIVEQGAIRYLKHTGRPTRSDDGKLHLSLDVPEKLGSEAAAAITQWRDRAEAHMNSDPMGAALELAKALQAIADLESLHDLFSERGIITPLWDYVYDLDRNDPEGWGPDPFMGMLPVILGAISKLRQPVTERLAQAVADHIRPDIWETVQRAVLNIREDYKAALTYARMERPELKEPLGDVDAVLDRYEAIRRAATTPWADGLRKAILSHRYEAEPTIETATIVRYSPDHSEISTGQGPRPLMEMVLDAIGRNKDEIEETQTATLNGRKEPVTYHVHIPKAARELIRKLPREDRTVSGLTSYLATWCEVVRDVATRTPGSGSLNVSAEMVVKARAATRDSRFVAREYQSRINDAHNVIDALSYMHVEASFPIPGGKRGSVRGPLIRYSSMKSITDKQGHTTRDVWTVDRKLPGFLGESALASTVEAALPKGDPYRQIDSAMRQYLMDQADRFYRHGCKRLSLPGLEVMNMGRKNPPEGKGDTRYKVQNYELVRVPDAYDRVLPDVMEALERNGGTPIRFTLNYDELKPTKKMPRRRKITGLVLSSVDSWKAANKGVM